MDIVLSYVASFLIIILVLPVHEFAHAFAAVKAGDPTPKLAGRYTINPLKHFDLVGLLMLILVRFGWAKPVPVNPYNFSKPRRDYFLVSIAGILANFIMAFVFSLLYAVYIQYVLPRIPITSVRSLEYVLAKLFYYVFFYGIVINLNLFAFNLIPVYPLDGFRILDCLLKRKGKFFNFLRMHGNKILLVLIVWGIICDALADRIGLTVFYKLDILGYALSFITESIFNLFTSFWGLLF